MKVYIASDHAGFDLKQFLIEKRPQVNWVDCGPNSADRVDYPDFADKAVLELANSSQDRAVLVCGSGQGMCMRANKYPYIRAALCYTEEVAQLSREHNDANVLCMGARLLSEDLALKILDTFLQTEFAGGRHKTRVDKIKGPLQ